MAVSVDVSDVEIIIHALGRIGRIKPVDGQEPGIPPWHVISV